jgi:hypothetical protein
MKHAIIFTCLTVFAITGWFYLTSFYPEDDDLGINELQGVSAVILIAGGPPIGVLLFQMTKGWFK